MRYGCEGAMVPARDGAGSASQAKAEWNQSNGTLVSTDHAVRGYIKLERGWDVGATRGAAALWTIDFQGAGSSCGAPGAVNRGGAAAFG